ncbi:MAG TPA: hypothetical protein VIM05_07800 [Gaiellaceae bacterium]
MVTAPGWIEVEALLAELAASQENFVTDNSDSNSISSYEPGRRLRLETGLDSVWVDIESIRGCWETLERLGRIKRSDVLEPGRRSAFMMALFQQVEGIRQERRGELYLVLKPRV